MELERENTKSRMDELDRRNKDMEIRMQTALSNYETTAKKNTLL